MRGGGASADAFAVARWALMADCADGATKRQKDTVFRPGFTEKRSVAAENHRGFAEKHRGSNVLCRPVDGLSAGSPKNAASTP